MTQAILDEAKAALHKLMLGQRPHSVMYDGRRIEFTQTTKGDLERYITRLETQLGVNGTRQRPRSAAF